MTFPATRAAALAQLGDFVPRAGADYARNRNHYGGPATTSRLSPAIRYRLLGEAEVCARVLAEHDATQAEKFIAEACWRTYWVGWLQQRPDIWRRYRADVAALTAQAATDASLRRGLAVASAGATGIDAFDAWVAELETNGWLHNHARMSFASIWIFTLKLPWQLGAAFFETRLLDACPASNTLSWRWVAGLQTAGKAYAARADLIRANSGGRFRVEAPLAKQAQPLPPDTIPPPSGITPPAAFDRQARTGQLVTLADLSLETLELPPVVAVMALASDNGAALPRAHAATALADGLTRAAAAAGCDADPADAVQGWAARHRLRQVVTGEAAVGPVADRLMAIEAALAADGVRLVRVRRDWDIMAWPAATRGFFAFKAIIPELLALGSGLRD